MIGFPANDEATVTRDFPEPVTIRWQPLRSGLVNIYKYDEEEFPFAQGRLLLRGNNGAGKSRVLALQLPFLLDGELAAHRVEPDGDPAKRIEWNLLMDRHENRLGYTWIEFGRREEDGTPHFTTLGCALHARKGSGIPPNARWFFVTAQRVGESLRLVSPEGFPLNRERLGSAVGKENVFQTARDYRAAVDRALFGLGQRYDPLIDLLLQLRKPQIMRDFREDDLSKLLSEAMPPLPPALIENIAVSFRSLESDRSALDDFALAHRSVEEFLRSYRLYVRAAVKRRADGVRHAHNRLDAVQRELKELESQQKRAAADIAQKKQDKERAETELISARQRERTLLDSPEMKSADALRQAEEMVRERTTQREDAKRLESQARESVEVARKAREEQEATLAKLRERFAIAHREVNAAAAEANMAEIPAKTDEPARMVFEREIARRRGAIAQLDVLNARVADAARRRDEVNHTFEHRRSDLTRCEENESDARTRCGQALDQLASAVYKWEESLAELQLDGGIDWRVKFELWLDDMTRPPPLVQAVEEGRQRRETALREEELRLRRERDQQEALQREAARERDRLLAGVQSEPPLSHTRSADVRETLPGAPLWKLCDFREDVSAKDRAGYEAALEAAGLLDAWVTPDGRALDSGSGEAFLTGDEKPTDEGLNSVLESNPTETGIDEDVVKRILSCIGARDGAGSHWVSPDGRWRHGLVRGAWSKPEAEFLGFASREAARLRRLAELTSQLQEIERELSLIEAGETMIAERRRKMNAEIDAVPQPSPLQEAAHALSHAIRASATSRALLEEADMLLSKARTALDAAVQNRDRDAEDLGLSRWKSSPETLRDRIGKLEIRAANLWPAHERVVEADSRMEDAVTRCNQAEDRLREAEERFAMAKQATATAESHSQTLRETVGSTVEEVLARLAETRKGIEKFDRQSQSLDGDLNALKIESGVIDERFRQANSQREEREVDRARAVSRLGVFAEKRLIEEAAPELQPSEAELPATRAVELARALHQALSEVDAGDEAWQRLQSGIQEQFSVLNNELVARGHHPVTEIVDEAVFAVTCAFQGQTRTMHDLDVSLRGEIASREEMLSAQERTVIENHLIGEAATELQTRIRAGEDWVAGVNEEMAAHPTSSGIKLRFRWEVHPDAPADLEAARKQLLKMTAAWSPVEREAMGRFLQGRIEAERKADEGASMQEHLTRALDYRGWHRFAVERHQEGVWKRLTKRTYGTGSGGEKALMLTMPQFAAAAAHYRSAHPHAPRLILLDEVFVGIDAPTRAKLMGLLVNFDLDFVMTSEREWGCYSTLPALSICHLASRPGVDAVAATHWIWNGRTRQRVSG